MTTYILVKYLHLLSVLIVVAMVAMEMVLVHLEINRKLIRRMFKIDGIYGLFSIIAVGAGLYLWFGIGKPAEFYSHNWIFLVKVGLFIIVGILSLWPTIFYMKNRKGEPNELVQLPSYVKRIVWVEFFLLLMIPLLAVTMAQGVGYN